MKNKEPSFQNNELELLERCTYLWSIDHQYPTKTIVLFLLFYEARLNRYYVTFQDGKFIADSLPYDEIHLPAYLISNKDWLNLCYFKHEGVFIYDNYYDRYKVYNDGDETLKYVNEELARCLELVKCDTQDVVVIGPYCDCHPLLYALQQKKCNVSSLAGASCVYLPTHKDYLLIDSNKLLMFHCQNNEILTYKEQIYKITVSDDMFSTRVNGIELGKFIPNIDKYTYSISDKRYYVLNIEQQFNVLGNLCCKITDVYNHSITILL